MKNKGLLIIAGVVLVGLAVWIGVRQYKNNLIDKILKSYTNLDMSGRPLNTRESLNSKTITELNNIIKNYIPFQS